jgi:phosphatidylglycerophosphate synthase
MRKIEKVYENPIDDILITISENTQDIFHNIGFNPNGITTLSLLFGIMATKQILNKNFKYAGILFLLAYFFDCMDGNMARTYNEVSVFGDYYDHFSDFIKIILVLWALYIVDANKLKKIFPIIVILFILSFVHLGCQELYYNNNSNTSGETSSTLSILNYICIANKDNVTEYMKYTKYIGSGTPNLFLVLIIMFFNEL